MGYRTDTMLAQGCELLGSMDNFSEGMPAEELFPELADEEERVGVNQKELDFRKKSMGFIPCVYGIDLTAFTPADLLGAENEEEYLERIFAEDSQDTIVAEFSGSQEAIFFHERMKNEALQQKQPRFSKPELECLAEFEKILLLQMAFLFGTSYYESHDSRHIIRKKHQDGISRRMMMVPAVVHFQTQKIAMRSDGTTMYIVEMPHQ